MAKRNQRNGRSQVQFRSRTTRSSKGKLVTDPAQNTQLLTEQLRSMGLYAAPTIGDGNCLFRALSDQLYGTESRHFQLRRDICDWIDQHKTRYEPFVEDERGLQVHLRCMRENATYGGHLELSAFAHMARRNIKVVQPGLVYVIEWEGGSGEPREEPQDLDDPMLDQRERRRLRRDKKRTEKEKEILGEGSGVDADGNQTGTIYVAYHDWEHFSSIRNLRGPYAGLPCVSEIAAADLPSFLLGSKKSFPKSKPKSISAGPSRTKTHLILPEADRPLTPSQIPLPFSRSPSPQIIFPSSASTPSSPPSSRADSVSTPRVVFRINRSPKRSFDESSGSSYSTVSDAIAKRTRSSQAGLVKSSDDLVMKEPEDASTPELSATASTSSSSSPSPPPPQATPPRSPQLTRRQRKALGLPKPRPVQGVAGKIVIPGGRYKRSLTVQGVRSDGDDDAEDDETDAEWKRNGTGRVDVRGFRELKI